MKSVATISILLFLLTLLADDTTFLVRGPAQGELYIGTPYYSTYDSGYEQHTYYAISHSFDNGEHIDIKYVSEDLLTDSLHINCPWLVSDATPGVIYCRTQRPDLWISYDYGETWQFTEQYGGSMYMSGCVEGEVYRRYDGLYISDNYGLTFDLLIDYIDIVTEIGVLPGEIYGIKSMDPGGWVPFGIYYCEDYGADFTVQCVLDSTITPNKLSRGTEPGELYMIDSSYGNCFIYRSIDYGQTFELMYQFSSIPVEEWSTHYTAGSQPGSFYFIKYRWVWAYSYSEDDVIAYVEMYTYYSDDYAGTFSEVYHHLLHPDSLSVEGNEVIAVNDINLINYPNPFNPSTTISFSVAQSPLIVEIDIYNLKGQKVRTLDCSNSFAANTRDSCSNCSVTWNGTDNKNKPVSSGIYFARLKAGKTEASCKMLLLK